MRRLLVVAALLTSTLLLGAGAASAHDLLVGSDPANGSSIQTTPAQITLRFNLPVRPGFNAMTVIGPDGSHWEDGGPTVDGSTVSVAVRPLGPAGRYQVGYRIVSDDGHPVTGETTFTLTVAGTGTPGPAGDPAAANSAPTETGGIPIWPFVLGAGVLVLLGIPLVLRSARRD